MEVVIPNGTKAKSWCRVRIARSYTPQRGRSCC